MLPHYPKFEPLRYEHMKSVAGFLNLSPRSICDLNLASVYVWQDCETPLGTLINGNLCILIQTHREPDYFLEPLGENSLVETVDICLKHTGRISRSSESFVGRLPKDRYKIAPLRDHFDYIYEVKSLAELKGKKHDGKRNQIRKFIKNQPDFRFALLESQHRDQALRLFERWAQERQNGNGESSLSHFGEECQRLALGRAFDAYQDLGFVGGAIFVGSEMEGFLLGSQGNPGMGIAHFQYASSKMPGIYQLILQKCCQEIFHAYPLLNMEEDLGIPGLRKTKLAYQPLHLEKKYLVTPT